MIHLYGTSLLRDKFSNFVATEAVVVKVGTDGTPARLCSRTGMASSTDVHMRLVEARGADGRRLSMFPELSSPSCAKTAGVLSTIPVSDLLIRELTASEGFKALLVSCDGCNANLAALRLLSSELQIHPTLLVLPVICASHGVNNSAKWGMGNFGYGSSETDDIVIFLSSL